MLRYDEFAEDEIRKLGLTLVPVTETNINGRLTEIMSFVNGVRREFNYKYGWQNENKEYFLNPLDRKFLYSYVIENEMKEIVFLSFVSVYGDRLHSHCTFTGKEFRSKGLAKLFLLKVCQKGIDDGFKTIGGFFPNTNNGSIRLFLKFGWQIQYMRNNIELFMLGTLNETAKNSMKSYLNNI